MNFSLAMKLSPKATSIRNRRAGILLSFLFALGVFSLGSAGSAGLEMKQLTLSEPLVVRWHYDSEQTLNLTPATEGQQVFLPLGGGTIVSLNSSDGRLNWKSDTGGEISASPAADDNKVYVASEYGDVTSTSRMTKGALRALGEEAGVTKWMRTLPAPIRGSLAVSSASLFAGASDGKVYAIDKKTGLTQWTNQYSSSFESQPILSGSLLFIGSEDGALYAIDQASGKTVWHYRTHGPIRGPAAVVSGTVYFGSGDAYVYAVREGDGRFLWRARTGAAVQSVARAGEGLLVASLDNFVYLLSLNRGSRLWKRQLSGRISSQPLTATDGALFVPLSSDSGIVLALRDGKQVNTLPIGEDNSIGASPVNVGDVVLVTTIHGLLAFSHPATSP
ncbi:MAG TPA: PQQ-binding-like beta-propeller repeat protein [Pyrinomonadaceae bacterium]|jgi:outer membrane protein assembly factor BamB